MSKAAVMLVDARSMWECAIDLDEMVACTCVELGCSRTQSRLAILHELGVDVLTHRDVDGWWFAVALEPSTSWSDLLDHLDLEQVLDSAEHKAGQVDLEAPCMPDAISDFAIPEVVDYAVQYLIEAPQVMAATEEIAEMGLIALLLDHESPQYFVCDHQVEQAYPKDPRPSMNQLKDLWRDYVESEVAREYEPELRDVESRRDDWMMA